MKRGVPENVRRPRLEIRRPPAENIRRRVLWHDKRRATRQKKIAHAAAEG